MIQDQDISIIVQGPIIQAATPDRMAQVTKMVCLRVRELFPNSELILSTNVGQSVDTITYDKVIFNVDPGATPFIYGNDQVLNNCNRLIVSTLAGIKAASRQYILKIRSDLFIGHKNFLKYFYKFAAFDKNYQFVKNRIIAFSIYSLKAHQTAAFTVQKPYHISDWAYFGYREDLYNLYDIPLTDEPSFSQWFLTHCRYFYDIDPDRLWKMPPEQYITTSFFKKYIPLTFEHMADTANDNVKLSARLLINNFLVLDQTQFCLISMKYLNFQLLFTPLWAKTAIFYHTFLQDYINYCPVKHKWRYLPQIIGRKLTYFMLNRSLRPFARPLSRLVSHQLKKWSRRHS